MSIRSHTTEIRELVREARVRRRAARLLDVLDPADAREQAIAEAIRTWAMAQESAADRVLARRGGGEAKR